MRMGRTYNSIQEGMEAARRLAQGAARTEQQGRRRRARDNIDSDEEEAFDEAHFQFMALELWMRERQDYDALDLYDNDARKVHRRIKKQRAKQHLQWLRDFDGISENEF